MYVIHFRSFASLNAPEDTARLFALNINYCLIASFGNRNCELKLCISDYRNQFPKSKVNKPKYCLYLFKNYHMFHIHTLLKFLKLCSFKNITDITIKSITFNGVKYFYANIKNITILASSYCLQ